MITPHYSVIVDATPPQSRFDDCDCACALALPGQGTTALVAGMVLERHPLLNRLPLDAAHELMYVPSLSKVAVVNQPAAALVEGLAEPQPLEALPAAARAPVARLLAAGIVRERGAPDPAPARPRELIAWLHVTNACNLRCTYCYIHKTSEAMEAETGFAAVDAVFRSAARHQYRRVVLKYAGGEATLNLALVEELHAYAQRQAEQRGVELEAVVLSNGVGLPRAKLERLRSLGVRLMISLDGPARIHDAQRPTLGGRGSHSRATASILAARDLGLALTISVTVTGASAPGLTEVVSWALEHDLHFTLNFYRENDCSLTLAELGLDERNLIDGMRAAYRVVEANLPRYSLLGCLIDRANLGAPHARTCAVGENYLVIDQRGAVAKCQMEIARPVTTIWAEDPLTTIRLDPVGVQNVPVDAKEGCKACEWRYWCAGGCPIATHRATGRYDLRSPNCAIYKALYPEVLRLEGLRLLKWGEAL